MAHQKSLAFQRWFVATELGLLLSLMCTLIKWKRHYKLTNAESETHFPVLPPKKRCTVSMFTKKTKLTELSRDGFLYQKHQNTRIVWLDVETVSRVFWESNKRHAAICNYVFGSGFSALDPFKTKQTKTENKGWEFVFLIAPGTDKLWKTYQAPVTHWNSSRLKILSLTFLAASILTTLLFNFAPALLICIYLW